MVRTRRLVPAAALLVLLALPAGAAAQERSCRPGSAGVPSAEAIRPQGDLRCADLSGADLSGVDLTQTDLSRALLAGANLSDTDLTQAELVGADLTGATLTGAELTQTELRGAVLTDVDLAGEDLAQVDLTDAVLTGADLTAATLVQAELEGADLSGADLTDADLSQAEARGADLSGATLRGADLTQADLTRADLSNADVTDADFTQADVDGADLTGIEGVKPYADWLLYGAGAALVVLVLLSVKRALTPERPSRYAATFASYSVAPPAPAVSPVWGSSGGAATMTAPAPVEDPVAPARTRVAAKLVTGLAGSVIAVLGLHLFFGGLIGTFVGMMDPIAALCDGPQCTVGVDSGPFGLTAGVFVAMFGFAVRARD